MKRRQLLRQSLIWRAPSRARTRENGCLLLREGGRHSVYYNPTTGKVSTVPRHTEVNEYLARKICRDLGIPSLS